MLILVAMITIPDFTLCVAMITISGENLRFYQRNDILLCDCDNVPLARIRNRALPDGHRVSWPWVILRAAFHAMFNVLHVTSQPRPVEFAQPRR